MRRRLIDSYELTQAFWHHESLGKYWRIVEEIIDEQPSVNAVRSEHGKWIREMDNGSPMLRCSVCSCRVQEDPYRTAVGSEAVSCPYCGANLDESEQLTMGVW